MRKHWDFNDDDESDDADDDDGAIADQLIGIHLSFVRKMESSCKLQIYILFIYIARLSFNVCNIYVYLFWCFGLH